MASMQPRLNSAQLFRSLRIVRGALTALVRDLGLAGWTGVALLIGACWVAQWAYGQSTQRQLLEGSIALVQTGNRAAGQPTPPVEPTTQHVVAPKTAPKKPVTSTVTDNASPPAPLAAQPVPIGAALAQLPVRGVKQPVAAAKLANEAQRGVMLSSVEYRWQKAGLRTAVHRLDLNITALGTYPQLRAWLSEFLARNPHAQLVETTIERRDAQAPLEARVVLALHYRTAGGNV
jgi:hypothetical protein